MTYHIFCLSNNRDVEASVRFQKTDWREALKKCFRMIHASGEESAWAFTVGLSEVTRDWKLKQIEQKFASDELDHVDLLPVIESMEKKLIESLTAA